MDPPTTTTICTLHQHTCPSCGIYPRWSTHPTLDSESAALESTLSSHAIIHRVYRDVAAPTSWSTLSFTINSPAMRAALSAALANYQDLDLDLDNWTFKPPYMPLVHRWAAISACGNADLLEFLEKELKEVIGSLEETKEKGKVRFDELWKIFPPGERVVWEGMMGALMLGRVVKGEKDKEGNGIWHLTVEYVDWDGEKCGWRGTTQHIHYFGGVKRVRELKVYPVAFREDCEEFERKMVERGRTWESLRGFCFREYRGRMLGLLGEGDMEVSGRIVIDAYAYYRSGMVAPLELRRLEDDSGTKTDSGAMKPSGRRSTLTVSDSTYQKLHALGHVSGSAAARRQYTSVSRRRLMPYSRPGDEERYFSHDSYSIGLLGSGDYYPEDEEDCDDYEDDDMEDEMDVSAAAADRKPVSIERREQISPLTDEQCMLASPFVIAMDLKSKQWGNALIDRVRNIEWNDNAFKNLVLPGCEKQLAWDFVESKAQSLQERDNDFVVGKGRGIIILMFGPPGVGKTFTAEAVSERARVPLYSIGAGTLGTNPADVELALDRALDLCRMWNAMLLLDEADVFLGTRTNDGLTRNELVSIFLTKLEYYQGILFLTTNRINSIDHAFRSRVDLFLPYKDLDPVARRQVWENFINLVGPDNFLMTEEDLAKLCELKLNGREIKNLIKTAQMLGYKNGGKVSADKLYMLAAKRVEALMMFED